MFQTPACGKQHAGLGETGKEVPVQQDLVTVDLRLSHVLSDWTQSLRQGRIRGLPGRSNILAVCQDKGKGKVRGKVQSNTQNETLSGRFLSALCREQVHS